MAGSVLRRNDEQSLLITLAMANALASHVFDRELMRRGLHVTQVGVLELIWRNEPITPTALTELVGHPQTTVRDRVRTLVRHGYVHRIPNEEDRRSYALATTRAGDRFMHAAVDVIRAAEDQLGQQLGTPLDEYREPLERLVRAARAALAEARTRDPRPTPSSDE